MRIDEISADNLKQYYRELKEEQVPISSEYTYRELEEEQVPISSEYTYRELEEE